MKQIKKITLAIFAMLAFISIVSCGNEKKIESIGGAVATFVKPGKALQTEFSPEKNDNVFRNLQFYCFDIKKPGTLEVWTESDVNIDFDRDTPAIYAKIEDGKFVEDLEEFFEYDYKNNISSENKNVEATFELKETGTLIIALKSSAKKGDFILNSKFTAK